MCGPFLKLFQAMDAHGPLVLSFESGVSVHPELSFRDYRGETRCSSSIAWCRETAH